MGSLKDCFDFQIEYQIKIGIIDDIFNAFEDVPGMKDSIECVLGYLKGMKEFNEKELKKHQEIEIELRK